jgi:hypothetical protein
MLMRLPIVFAILLALTAFSGCVSANICAFMMVEKVNQLLPREKQYSQLWWYPGKLFRLYGDYRRLLPHGQLSRYMVAMMIITGVSLLTAFAIIVAISPDTTAR